MSKPNFAAQFLLGWLISYIFLIACSQTKPTINTPSVTANLPTPVVEVATAVPPTATVSPTCDPFTPPATTPPTSVPTYSYNIINSYPHDPDAFTQGLVFVDGILYESTGIKRTPSSLRQVELISGEVLQMQALGVEFFGEGLTLWQDKLIQLTWKNQVAFVYDKDNFALLDSWQYDTEGWGITHNGRCLIMSDGSSNLYFRDPETFAEVGRITVQNQNGPVNWLNELEFIEGEIWANVWRTNLIMRIDPASGQVVGNIDLTGLLDAANLTEPVDVLNGIAYDEENGRLFVTGKLWPTLFEIELVPQNN